MSFEGRVITPIALAKIEFPGHTVRLCDGGFSYFGGEKYTSRDDVFGVFGAVGESDEGSADMAPGGTLVLLPPGDVALKDIAKPEYQNARIRWWFGELDADGKTVINAQQLDDGLIDTMTPKIGRGTLSIEVVHMARAEKFFSVNEGNTLSPSFHRRVWPDEAGLDNANGSQRNVAWGAATPPRGSVVAGGGGGGGGGNYGGYNNEVMV